MFNWLKDFAHNFKFETKRLVSLDSFRSKDYGLDDLLLFSRFVDNGIILNVDGSFTAMVKCKPADLDAETEATRDYVGLVVHKAFRALDSGWCLHADCVRRESSGYIAEDDCHFTNAATFSIDHERRLEYNREGKHYENEYILTFTYLPPSDRRSKFGAYFVTSEDKKVKKKIRKEVKKRVQFDYSIYLEQFKDTLAGVIDCLASSQFQIFKMSDEEIFAHLFYCVNGIHAKIKIPKRHWTDLRTMLANQDIITGSNPQIGDKYISVVSMGEHFPLETYPAMLKGLNSLGFEYRWSTRYIFLSVADAIKMVNKLADFHYQKRESATKIISKQYGSGESGKTNRAAIRYADEAEEALSAIEMQDYRYGKYTACVILFDENPEQLAEKVKLVKSVIDNCNLMGKVERTHCFEAYLGAIPSMVRPNVRKWIMNSFNLADLIPTSAVWSGYKNNPCKYYKENNPVLFYAATAGSTPFRGCLHVEDEGHTLVIGANGSLVMNFLAAQQCRYKNSKVFIFDNNHASLPLTYSIPDSVHYDLGYNDSTTFKPLAHLDNQADFTFAVEWLAKLCEVNGFKVKPVHITAISSALELIRDTAQISQRTMSYFSYHMRPKGKDMEEFAEQFKPYISSGASLQSQIFDATENQLNLTDFTVFEMSQLARMGDATLIPTVLYLFHMIERSLDGSPVSIYIHDGWTIFKHPVFRDFLDDWLRKIATKNVQIVIGVHQPADITKSEIADILMQSCKTKILTANLNANGSQKTSYEELGLNETQISLIANAMVNREYYFTNQLGSRLIQFNLGELAKAFLQPPSLEELALIKQKKSEYSELFGYQWIKHKQLINEIADFWLEKHNSYKKVVA